MRIKIEMYYQTNTNPHFFQEKTTISFLPTYARVYVLDGDGPIAIEDGVKESERNVVTIITISNKTDFEKLSSVLLEKFLTHLKDNYPKLKTIEGYDEKYLANLIITNKLKEDILQKEHKIVPQLVQRICESNSEDKIPALDRLNIFLQNATEQEIDQLENKILQLDQRHHYFSDLIKSLGSIVAGWSVGLGLMYEVTRKMTPATGVGWAFGLLMIAAGSIFGLNYGLDYLNSDAEDVHRPENDKISSIRIMCSAGNFQ